MSAVVPVSPALGKMLGTPKSGTSLSVRIVAGLSIDPVMERISSALESLRSARKGIISEFVQPVEEKQQSTKSNEVYEEVFVGSNGLDF